MRRASAISSTARSLAPKDGSFFDVSNPANGTKLARVAQGSAADVDAAVKAARKAFPSWSKLPGHVRATHLYAIARLIQKRERFLSVLETMDNGKPIRESRDIDVPLVARHFYHHAGWAELIADEFPGYRPVGVCGQIIPWNFPLLMLAWKIAPALAAGNTVVLKPAEYTPLTALAFAEICREAGLPPGVVNIVTGDGGDGCRTRRPCRRRQDRLHRLDRSGTPHPQGHGGFGQEAVTGTRRQVALHRARGCRSRCRGRRRCRCDLVQPGPGLLCGFAPSRAGGHRAEVSCASCKRRMETLRVGDPLDKSIDMGAIVDRDPVVSASPRSWRRARPRAAR